MDKVKIIVADNNTEEEAKQALANGTRIFDRASLNIEDYEVMFGVTLAEIDRRMIRGICPVYYEGRGYIIFYDLNTIKGWKYRR